MYFATSAEAGGGSSLQVRAFNAKKTSKQNLPNPGPAYPAYWAYRAWIVSAVFAVVAELPAASPVSVEDSAGEFHKCSGGPLPEARTSRLDVDTPRPVCASAPIFPEAGGGPAACSAPAAGGRREPAPEAQAILQ